MRRLPALAWLALAAPAGAGVDVVPRVGADFEHFGQTYRITADLDTVTVIDDSGTFAGILLRTPGAPPTRFELDVEAYAGRSTRRARTRLEARWTGVSDRLEIRQEASFREFREDGDYTVSGDHFEERVAASWERRLGGGWSLRLRDGFDGIWYRDPDPYNLTAWTHEPRADVRLDFGEWSRLRAGVRFAKRDVPDSSTLGYRRVGAEAEISWLVGATTSLDVVETLERRRYDAASVRESSWENRIDARFESALSGQVTCRILHENEVMRFDEPDDLDYDSNRLRSGVQFEWHRGERLDLSLTPLHSILTSGTAPEEEYAEFGVEVGLDWRFGRRGWLGVTNEIGRRDYRVDAAEPETDLAASVDGGASLTAASDYTYDRVTLILGAEPWRGVAVNLFVHWQPESHAVRRHDTDTRIVSGGVTWSF